MNIRNRTRNAFTLIEILIVVVILGILAAVVIPQFTNAADSANDSTVRTQLQTLRSQIELYRVENGGADPALNTANGWADLVNGGYLPGPPKNPITGASTFGNAATDGWQFVDLALDGSQNWTATGATQKVLVANKADGTYFNDYSNTP